jgi:hypothetical protein
MNALGKVLVAVLLVAALAFVGGGAFLIVERDTGTRAKATVTRCVESGGGRLHRTDCTGTWIVRGRVVVGTIEGVDSSDVGKTIDVTVSGEHAYTRSLVRPILFIGLGLPLAALSGLALFSAGRPNLSSRSVRRNASRGRSPR